MDEVEEEAKATAADNKKPIGRPHIAAILLRKGYVSSIKQAFDKYLAPRRRGLLRQGAAHDARGDGPDPPVRRHARARAPGPAPHGERRRSSSAS